MTFDIYNYNLNKYNLNNYNLNSVKTSDNYNESIYTNSLNTPNQTALNSIDLYKNFMGSYMDNAYSDVFPGGYSNDTGTTDLYGYQNIYSDPNQNIYGQTYDISNLYTNSIYKSVDNLKNINAVTENNANLISSKTEITEENNEDEVKEVKDETKEDKNVKENNSEVKNKKTEDKKVKEDKNEVIEDDNDEEVKEEDDKMDAKKAANVLLNKFDEMEEINDTWYKAKDGKLSWDELDKVAKETKDKELKEAVNYFKDHKHEFNKMENSGNNGFTNFFVGDDNVFSEKNLNKFIEGEESAKTSSSVKTSSKEETKSEEVKKEVKEEDDEMDAEKAANVLVNNFEEMEEINDTWYKTQDGKLSWDELDKVAEETDNKELKEAVNYFKDHKHEFNKMENSGNNGFTNFFVGDDDVFSEKNLNKFIEAEESEKTSSKKDDSIKIENNETKNDLDSVEETEEPEEVEETEDVEEEDDEIVEEEPEEKQYSAYNVSMGGVTQDIEMTPERQEFIKNMPKNGTFEEKMAYYNNYMLNKSY